MTESTPFKSEPRPAKYIYLDIVDFTKNRTIEAQTEIIGVMNTIVKESVQKNVVHNENVIYLPTGDGICIVLLNVDEPFDIHMLIALSIIESVEEYNAHEETEMLRFRVRIGINANIDNVIHDINGNMNIAGAGINMAERIMSLADGNHVLVSQSVYDILNYREKYNRKFHAYHYTDRQQVSFQVYQFLDEACKGLNRYYPKIFKPPDPKVLKLTKEVAYYFAHCIKNRTFLLEHKGINYEDASIILLWFLSTDSKKYSDASEIDIPTYYTFKAKEANMQEQMEYYSKIDIWVQCEFAQLIIGKYLSAYNEFFEGDYAHYTFINQKGVEKLKSEWPNIWTEFGLN